MITVGDRVLNRNIAWSNFWGGIGLVGINSRNQDLFRTTREMIADTIIDEFDFCSVPKLALEADDQNLSAMLRRDMRELETAAFPRLLGKKMTDSGAN